MSERRGIVIGTGGHVDHGKTALVKALTGVETDRWREERERGLTIDIGFARLALAPELEIGVVDVPGHEDYLKNMLAGATGIDVLLLVVAADEGPMPQTREHLAIARLLGVGRGVVALTKRDRVDADWLELVRDATAELLSEAATTAAWPTIPVSSVTGEGLDALRDALRVAASDVAARQDRDLFRLPVDRAFTIHGTGTVVTGTVWSGAVSVGDAVTILPGPLQGRVRGLEVHGEARERVGPGRRCAAALVGVTPAQAGRGAVVVMDEAWRPCRRLGVRIETVASHPRPLEHGQRVRLYLGTREVMARVLTADRAGLAPGARGWATLQLETPLVARARDRGILRFYSPVTTIGGARVAELEPPPAWQERIGGWERILEGTVAEAFEAVVGLAGLRGARHADLPVALGRDPAAVAEAAEGSECVRLGDRWFSPPAWSDGLHVARQTVARMHAADRRAPGVSRESVRSALAGICAPELAESAIDRLVADEELVAAGPRLSLPGRGPRLTPEEEAGRERLLERISEAGLQPPRIVDLGREMRLARPVLDDLLRLLQEEGATRPITPEIHVSTTALEAMVSEVRRLLAGGAPAPPTIFKERFGLSRKYLIPLLEYLDREGVTRRTGEGRVLVE